MAVKNSLRDDDNSTSRQSDGIKLYLFMIIFKIHDYLFILNFLKAMTKARKTFFNHCILFRVNIL